MTRRELLKMGGGALVLAAAGPVWRSFAAVEAAGLKIETYTSAEPAAMSNSYLISGDKDAFLFDIVQMRHEALGVVDMIRRSGKNLRFVWISHSHPDHFLGLDVLGDAFPDVPIYSTPGVVGDIAKNGPGLVQILSKRWGDDGPRRLVVPQATERTRLDLEGAGLQVHTFENGESAHLANIHFLDTRRMLTADIVYDRTHLFLRERNIDGWLAQLREFESFANTNLSELLPGHGHPGTPDLISATRRYLEDFKGFLALNDAAKVKAAVLEKYPDYAMPRLLTDYTLPAFFPDAPTSH